MDKVYIVYLIILGLIVLLYTEWLRPAVSFLLMAVALIIFDIVPTDDILHGFANEQLAVIMMLLIISNMISHAGIVDNVFQFLTSKRKSSGRSFLFKMTSGVGLTSGFFNNTPLVAIFMPYVHRWCNKTGNSPSKYLIPLSYASILGGCMTLVGTSTNLIVNGLSMESGFDSLHLFDFTIVGGVMFVIGLVYLLTIGQKLLPDKSSAHDEVVDESRRYFVETHVKPNSLLIGRTIEEAGLRNLDGLFLIEIMRGDQNISPVSPKEVLMEDDVLFFAGDVKAIKDIRNPQLGLSLPKFCHIPEDKQDQIVEVVVAHNSRLIGNKIQDSDFRGRYDGAILAVHRDGERLMGKIGEIVIQPGDLLLVLTGNDFYSRIRNNPAFYILSSEDMEKDDKPVWRGYLMVVGLITALSLSFFDIPLFKSLAVLLGIGVLINISTPNQIRNNIDFNLFIIIALGLALGKAMISTGAAEQITGLIGFTDLGSPVAILLVLFIITNLLASFITSKAAVAITVPIAFHIFSQTGMPYEPLILSVAFGGAANFITPIGYQTNLMVYGPGRYRFSDFFKIGLPLTIVYCLASSFILAIMYDLI